MDIGNIISLIVGVGIFLAIGGYSIYKMIKWIKEMNYNEFKD